MTYRPTEYDKAIYTEKEVTAKKVSAMRFRIEQIEQDIRVTEFWSRVTVERLEREKMEAQHAYLRELPDIRFVITVNTSYGDMGHSYPGNVYTDYDGSDLDEALRRVRKGYNSGYATVTFEAITENGARIEVLK